jgi:hypothetical protein
MLGELGEFIDTERFRQVFANAERARNAFESARDALEVHVDVHRCGLLD